MKQIPAEKPITMWQSYYQKERWSRKETWKTRNKKKRIHILETIIFQQVIIYGLLKIHKSNKEPINEYIEIHETDDSTLIPLIEGPNCPTRPYRFNFNTFNTVV